MMFVLALLHSMRRWPPLPTLLSSLKSAVGFPPPPRSSYSWIFFLSVSTCRKLGGKKTFKWCFLENVLRLIKFIGHVVRLRRRFQSSPDTCRVRGLIYGNSNSVVSIAQCAFCVIGIRCFLTVVITLNLIKSTVFLEGMGGHLVLCKSAIMSKIWVPILSDLNIRILRLQQWQNWEK